MKKAFINLAIVFGGFIALVVLLFWGMWLLLRPLFYIPVFIYYLIRDFILKKNDPYLHLDVYGSHNKKQIIYNIKKAKQWQKNN